MTLKLPEELNNIIEKFSYLKFNAKNIHGEQDSKSIPTKNEVIYNEEIRCILNRTSKGIEEKMLKYEKLTKPNSNIPTKLV